ncbi:hypothetical protein Sta7437_1506 [Stanieria cyanosphaera PCC 7437]|uniref:Uncharacterized protein n=1 Tax=Stanieria cyanosphaera (strain ATCC 29371 / PCC 7437) TaxID=111780 RepID=K9XRD3_STAC7|nr:hypothetical protein Sta7437_1506 [Stanieria cyanosphaera PCC 7437]
MPVRVVYKYQAQIEEAFGHLSFHQESVVNSVGARNKAKYALLS